MLRTSLIAAGLLLPLQVLAAANCAHSQSWQCQQQAVTSGSLAPVTPLNPIDTQHPDPGAVNQVIGGTAPDHHNVALVPLGPKGKPGDGAKPHGGDAVPVLAPLLVPPLVP